MAEELKACPFCGSHDVEVQGKPAILDALDSVCCNECSADAPYPVWNTRAQIPSQGGEAVEVVAYHGKDPDGGEGFVGARWPNAFGEDCIVEPLMTVAQHQRILAAATHPAGQVGEAVAWLTSDKRHLVFSGALDQSQYVEQGMTPLYTHPADQVARGVVVSRELLDSLLTVIDSNGYAADEVEVVDELRALLNGGQE